MIESTELAERYAALSKKIRDCWDSAPRATRAKNPPKLIAVSKGQHASQIFELYKRGHRDFGENYVQELLDKDTLLTCRGLDEIRWHFIGHLQSNKVKTLIERLKKRLVLIHSVGSMSLAQEVAKRATVAGIPLRCLLEINIDAEPTKSGFAPSELTPTLITQVCGLPTIRVEGLMTIPSANWAADPAASSPFRRLAELAQDANLARSPFTALSMGMSEDFEAAVREGATHVRIGTALFGPRAPREPST